MKQIKQWAGKLLATGLLVGGLTSCYSTTTCVGTLDTNTPMVKVNSVKNHHLIYGLVPLSNTKIQDSKYVGKATNYQVKKQQSFIDGLLNFLTWGIYTPTTTTYYLPLQTAQ